MKGAGLALAAGLGVLAFLPRPANACAGCRNPNMPVTRMEAAHLRAGELRIGAILGVTTLHVVHEAGCADLSDCSERPIQPLYLHDQRIWPGDFRRACRYTGISRRVTSRPAPCLRPSW
jgi:hypothetical protein